MEQHCLITSLLQDALLVFSAYESRDARGRIVGIRGGFEGGEDGTAVIRG